MSNFSSPPGSPSQSLTSSHLSIPRDPPPPFTTLAVRHPSPRPSVSSLNREAPSSPRPLPWPPLTIGQTPIYAPLVTLREAKNHLRLLEAFRRQRIDVEHSAQIGSSPDGLTPEQRYKVFLSHATWRYQEWVKYFARTGIKDDDAVDVMPLDVALAWHTHCMSPRWYREDCKRLHPGLTWKADDDDFVPKSYPLHAIAQRLDEDYKLPEGRPGVWEKTVGSLYDPLDALSAIKNREITCPRCDKADISVSHFTKKGTGLTQDFQASCSGCQLTINHETLGVGRLAHDLALRHPKVNYMNDDTIEEGLLSNGFDATASTWEVRFHSSKREREGADVWKITDTLWYDLLKLSIAQTPPPITRIPALAQSTSTNTAYTTPTHASEHNSILVVEVAQRRRARETPGKGKESSSADHEKPFRQDLRSNTRIALREAEAPGSRIAGRMDEEEVSYVCSIVRFAEDDKSVACDFWAIFLHKVDGSDGEVHWVKDHAPPGSTLYKYHFTPGVLGGSSKVFASGEPFELQPLFTFLPISLEGIRRSIGSVRPPRPLLFKPESKLETRGSQEWVVDCLRRLEDDYGGALVTREQCLRWEGRIEKSMAPPSPERSRSFLNRRSISPTPSARSTRSFLDDDPYPSHSIGTSRPAGPSISQSTPNAPSLTPDTLLAQLESLLANKATEIQLAGRLGEALLGQQAELEARIREVAEVQQNFASSPAGTRRAQREANGTMGEYAGSSSDEEKEVGAETKKKLAALEEDMKKWDEGNSGLYEVVGNAAAKGVPALHTTNDLNPESPPRKAHPGPPPESAPRPRRPSAAFVPPANSLSQSLAPSAMENGAESASSSRRSRNNAQHRTNDIELATEIGQSLLGEVRRLQSLLAEREEHIRDMNESREQLERELQDEMATRRTVEENVEKFKEENWNLEFASQETAAQLSEAHSAVHKADLERQRVAKELASTRDTLDFHRLEAERLAGDLDQLKQRHETDMANMRKQAAGLQRDRSDLQGHLEGLKTEIATNARGIRRAGSKKPGDVDHDSEDGEDAEEDGSQQDSDDVFRVGGRRKTGDGFLPHPSPSALFDDAYGESPDNSPVQRSSMPAGDEGRTSLAHAQRTISTLRASLAREKAAKMELRRQLADGPADQSWEEDEPSSRDATPARSMRGSARRRGSTRKRGGAGVPSRLGQELTGAGEAEEEEEEVVDSFDNGDANSLFEHNFHAVARNSLDEDDLSEAGFDSPMLKRGSLDMDPDFANVLDREQSDSDSMMSHGSPSAPGTSLAAALGHRRGGSISSLIRSTRPTSEMFRSASDVRTVIASAPVLVDESTMTDSPAPPPTVSHVSVQAVPEPVPIVEKSDFSGQTDPETPSLAESIALLSAEHAVALSILHASNDLSLTHLKEQHAVTLSQRDVDAQETLAQSLGQLKAEHAVALSTLQATTDLAITQLKEQHASALSQRQAEAQEMLAQSVSQLDARHATVLALREAESLDAMEKSTAQLKAEHAAAFQAREVESQDTLVKSVSQLNLEHAAAIEQREVGFKDMLAKTVAQIKADHATALQVLKTNHEAAMERSLSQLKTEHAAALALLALELKSTSEKSIAELKSQHATVLQARQSDHEAAMNQSLSTLKAEHSSALKAREADLIGSMDKSVGVLSAEHAAALHAREAEFDSAMDKSASQLKAEHAAFLLSRETELKGQMDESISQLNVNHASALEIRDSEHKAALEQWSAKMKAEHEVLLASREAELKAQMEESIQKLGVEHSSALQTREGEHKLAVGKITSDHLAALAELKGHSDATLNQLKVEHASTVEQREAAHQSALESLSAQLKADHEALILSREAELQGQQDDSIKQLGTEHAAILQTRELGHIAVLERLRSEHSAALESRDASYAKELDQLRAEHDEAFTQMVGDYSESTSTLREEHKLDLSKLKEQHAADLSKLKEEHAAAIAALLAQHVASRATLSPTSMEDRALSVRPSMENLTPTGSPFTKTLDLDADHTFTNLAGLRHAPPSSDGGSDSGANETETETDGEFEDARESIGVASPAPTSSATPSIHDYRSAHSGRTSRAGNDSDGSDMEVLQSPVVRRTAKLAAEPKPVAVAVESVEVGVQTENWTPTITPTTATFRPRTYASDKRDSINTFGRPDVADFSTFDPSIEQSAATAGAYLDSSSLRQSTEIDRSSLDIRPDSAFSTLTDDPPRPVSRLDKGKGVAPLNVFASTSSSSMAPPSRIVSKKSPRKSEASTASSSSLRNPPPPRPTSPPPADLLYRAQSPAFDNEYDRRTNGLLAPTSAKSQGSTSGIPAPRSASSLRNQNLHPNMSIYTPKGKGTLRQQSRKNSSAVSLSDASFLSDHSRHASRVSMASSRTSDGGYDSPMRTGGDSTDPAVIHAITQTMIGEFLFKYTTKAFGKGISEKRHKRFFWVHPYTKTLYWSSADPGAANTYQSSAKSVYIEGVSQVLDPNPMPPGLHQGSIIVKTPNREMKFTASTRERHDMWFQAINYLLARPDVAAPNPNATDTPGRTGPLRQRMASEDSSDWGTPKGLYTHGSASDSRLTPKNGPRTKKLSTPSTYKRAGTVAAEYEQRTTNFGSPRSLRTFSDFLGGQDSVEFIDRREIPADAGAGDEDDTWEGLENVRACCDGKHDVGSLSRRGGQHHHHHHHHQNGGSSADLPDGSPTRSRSRSSNYGGSVGSKASVWSAATSTGRRPAASPRKSAAPSLPSAPLVPLTTNTNAPRPSR
ncbi:hypothetical protein P7C70_g3841, partial [Phenoliferia sp. Uapishka_3]